MPIFICVSIMLLVFFLSRSSFTEGSSGISFFQNTCFENGDQSLVNRGKLQKRKKKHPTEAFKGCRSQAESNIWVWSGAEAHTRNLFIPPQPPDEYSAAVRFFSFFFLERGRRQTHTASETDFNISQLCSQLMLVDGILKACKDVQFVPDSFFISTQTVCVLPISN